MNLRGRAHARPRSMMTEPRVRSPAVAGRFYPLAAGALSEAVDCYLAAAAPAGTLVVKALIAPHAGYTYSGPVAGSAFATLRDRAAVIRRVILLGPSHFVAFHGLALPEVEMFETPLGRIPVDARLVELVADLPQVWLHPPAHVKEHALEVELPFLQRVLGEFSLLPLVVGEASSEEVDQVLETVWGGEETLIVVSSDLSHYLPAAYAKRFDRETADAILALAEPLGADRACGARAIDGLLRAARRHGLVAHELDLRTSGDTAGGLFEVVGYGAFAFTAGATN